MTKREIWKPVADIPQNTIFMMWYPMKMFFEQWPKWGFGAKFNRYFTLFKGDFSQMVYLAKEFDEQTEYLANKMIKNPLWAYAILKKVEKWATLSLIESRRIKYLPLRKMSNQQIIKLMVKLRKNHELHHGLGAGISWKADADKERVTKAIMQVIANRAKDSLIKKTTPEIFSMLTTPLKESFLQKEEKNFLQIAQAISLKKKLQEVFIHSDLEELEDNLKKLDQRIYRKIMAYYQTFTPFTYQYKGPAYPLSDYLGRWQAFFRQGGSATKALVKLNKDKKHLKREQQQLFKAIKFSSDELDLIKLGQMLVFIKDYRKNVVYSFMYYYEYIFKEIGRRFNLSVGQIQAMTPLEIINLLKNKKIDVNKLNQRQPLAIDYWERRKNQAYHKILVGKEAKKFLQRIVWQKVNKKARELTGTCAYPGKVTGIVKVINIPEEMKKMAEGNIMVAHNTNPNLVPAMKKAAALVGAAGGLTCHTAIVAREMKIPCIVGALDCDRILKDGDRVEVDATNGIVKRIK